MTEKREPPTKEEFQKAADKAKSLTEMGSLLGYKINNGLPRILRRLGQKYEVALPIHEPSSRQQRPSFHIKDIDYFTLGKKHSGSSLRSRLIKIGRKYECEMCSLGPVWLDEPLTIQVDHINGNKFDSTKENLRFLCPNCHSQTDNFRAKNKIDNKAVNSYCACGRLKYSLNKKCTHCDPPPLPRPSKPRPVKSATSTAVKKVKINPEDLICECGASKIKTAARCAKCDRLHRIATGIRSTTETEQEKLVKSLLEEPFTSVAKKMKVSDNTLRQRLKAWGYDPNKVTKARTAKVNVNDFNLDDLK